MLKDELEKKICEFFDPCLDHRGCENLATTIATYIKSKLPKEKGGFHLYEYSQGVEEGYNQALEDVRKGLGI